MPIDTLFAAAPLLISATFDKLWVDEIVISAPQIGGDATARVRLRYFRSNGNAVDAAPTDGVWLTVPNLLAAAESDEDLEAAVTAIMAYVAKVAEQQGLATTAPA